jgi:hypothetical protein
MDEAAAAANLRRFRRRVPGVPLLRMAAAFDEGLAEFKQAIRRAVEAAGPAAAAGPDAA